MLGYQNYPRGAAEVQGLRLVPPGDGQVTAGTAKLDLSLFIVEDGDRLVGTLEYNSDLFDATTMRRLVGHFESLLTAAVAQPETALGLLPLMSEGERHQLALEWNDTGSSYPAESNLPRRFEAQARRTPDATALRGARELTYAQLDRLSDQLKHRLRRLGVGPESRVALCFERSPEMVVAMLGILKAGGAYVPLDPSYPRRGWSFCCGTAALRRW